MAKEGVIRLESSRMRGLIRLGVLCLLVAALHAGCSNGGACTGSIYCLCGDSLCHGGACSDNCGNVCESFEGQQFNDGGTESCTPPKDAG
jgi:hypothetical protein